jgi:hypothetical protein
MTSVVPRPGRAGELERPAECLDAVAEPDAPGSPLGVGASDAVVADLHLEPAVLGVDGDHGLGSVRVFEDVGERFADDEVRRCLYAGAVASFLRDGPGNATYRGR